MKFLQKSLAFFLGTEYDERDGQTALYVFRQTDRSADQETG